MSYYQRHVFICINDRGEDAERPSCNQCGSAELAAYAKRRVKALGMHGAGHIRVNKAGCLDRCEEGPACVIYPEGIWYTFVDEEDLDEIIDSHLLRGEPVERLRLTNKTDANG